MAVRVPRIEWDALFDFRATDDAPPGHNALFEPRSSSKLGNGQFGEVHKAMLRSSRDGRLVPVAIKFVMDRADERRTLEEVVAEIDEETQQQYAVSQYSVFCASVLGFCATSSRDGRPGRAIVMERAIGNMSDIMVRGKYYEEWNALPMEDRILRLAGLWDAVVMAHKWGMVHADIKLENVLLAEGLIPKLADFGLARTVAADTQVEELAAMLTGTLRVPLADATHDDVQEAVLRMDPGGARGTPLFSTPAVQVSGLPPDRSTDVYGMALVMSCALSGTAAAVTGPTFGLLANLKRWPPVALAGVLPEAVPRAVRDSLDKCVKYDDRVRPTAEDMRLVFSMACGGMSALHGLMLLAGPRQPGEIRVGDEPVNGITVTSGAVVVEPDGSIRARTAAPVATFRVGGPLMEMSGQYYFEVCVKNPQLGAVVVGAGNGDFTGNSAFRSGVGGDDHSWGLNTFDGRFHHVTSRQFLPRGFVTEEDVLQCVIDTNAVTLRFGHNGKWGVDAPDGDIRHRVSDVAVDAMHTFDGAFYATVSLANTKGLAVWVNTGAPGREFKFAPPSEYAVQLADPLAPGEEAPEQVPCCTLECGMRVRPRSVPRGYKFHVAPEKGETGLIESVADGIVTVQLPFTGCWFCTPDEVLLTGARPVVGDLVEVRDTVETPQYAGWGKMSRGHWGRVTRVFEDRGDAGDDYDDDDDGGGVAGGGAAAGGRALRESQDVAVVTLAQDGTPHNFLLKELRFATVSGSESAPEDPSLDDGEDLATQRLEHAQRKYVRMFGTGILRGIEFNINALEGSASLPAVPAIPTSGDVVVDGTLVHYGIPCPSVFPDGFYPGCRAAQDADQSVELGSFVRIRRGVVRPMLFAWNLECQGEVGRLVMNDGEGVALVSFPSSPAPVLCLLSELEHAVYVELGDMVSVREDARRRGADFQRGVGVVTGVDFDRNTVRVDFDEYDTQRIDIRFLCWATTTGPRGVAEQFAPQQLVRLRRTLVAPIHGSHEVQFGEVGKVLGYEDGGIVLVRFPSNQEWRGYFTDLQRVVCTRAGDFVQLKRGELEVHGVAIAASDVMQMSVLSGRDGAFLRHVSAAGDVVTLPVTDALSPRLRMAQRSPPTALIMTAPVLKGMQVRVRRGALSDFGQGVSLNEIGTVTRARWDAGYCNQEIEVQFPSNGSWLGTSAMVGRWTGEFGAGDWVAVAPSAVGLLLGSFGDSSAAAGGADADGEAGARAGASGDGGVDRTIPDGTGIIVGVHTLESSGDESFAYEVSFANGRTAVCPQCELVPATEPATHEPGRPVPARHVQALLQAGIAHAREFKAFKNSWASFSGADDCKVM